MQPVIRFENVGKLYRLGTVGTGWLSHDIKRWWITSIRHKEDPYLLVGETNDRSTKGRSEYVYALKDINLEVQEGDVLGIIGKNGAGKSTLLKLLSRVTTPTTGKIYTKGRIASLLEVGTGFHPELTGRENIYMNGCILGMKRWEIDKKIDEIVDFSGCERYIDTPVKRYSSGMMVRLGFSVAAHLNPEILVVDEVLAVGDAEFQKKAIGKMQDVSKGQGRTVLFVSHNLDSIRKLCNRSILLENGMISFDGATESCINQYLSNSYRNQESSFSFDIHKDIIINSPFIKISSVSVNGERPTTIHLPNDNFKLSIDIEGELEIPFNFETIIQLIRSDNTIVGTFVSTHINGVSHFCNEGHFHINESINIPKDLTNSEYYIALQLTLQNQMYLVKIPYLTEIIKKTNISEHTGVSFDDNYGYYILSTN